MDQALRHFQKKLKNSVPEYAQVFLEDELERYAQLLPSAPESQSLKVYLEWVFSLPWFSHTEDKLDPSTFFKEIDRQHLGREKLKERIAEYVAVGAETKNLNNFVFCFVGPPGVGKTHLAMTIAKALGRKTIDFYVSDLETESALRGRRREGPSPTPGQVLDGLRQVGVRNPIIILKGLDRPGSRWAVDPVTTLLQTFDPVQSKTFIDHYLGFPFDLSKALFITTALTVEDIPIRLLDRLEVFHLSAYTPEEKLKIVKKNLLPDALRLAGLKKEQFDIPSDLLIALINHYTRESGVHRLEQLLDHLCQNAAYRLATEKEKKIVLTEEGLVRILGPSRYELQSREHILRPGVVTGLVWTPVGGDIIFVEVSVMPGKGKVIITGQIGEVMRESAEIAVSFVRSESHRFGLDLDLSQKDVHIHVPHGSIQKDGPSAGVTILVALYSWFTKKMVDPEIAMTGEVTLRGTVIRVGAIKEKVIAAHRAGIKTVFLPKSNEQDLVEITDEIRSGLIFRSVASVEEILEVVLGIKNVELFQRAQVGQ